jgi:hypothetical protein
VPPLVGRRDEAVLGGEPLRLAPERGDFDAIYAIAPRVPLLEPGLVLTIGQLVAIQLAARKLAYLGELRLYFGADAVREDTVEVRPQHAVVVILIPELRGRLDE